MKHLLIVDDEEGGRESLKAIFCKTHRVSAVVGAREAEQVLAGERIDLILLDNIMPDKDGVTFLAEARDLYPDIPIIMVSGSRAVRPALEALRGGAFEYLTKPYDVEEIRRVVDLALERNALHRRVEALQGDLSREFPVDHIVGRSEALRQAMENIRKAAETDSTVLISG
ncbi:MAG: response regulator, partial [Lentisphaerota bacterium]